MDLRPNRGAGVFQIVCQEIVSGDVESVGDKNQKLKTWCSCASFNVAYMNWSRKTAFPKSY